MCGALLLVSGLICFFSCARFSHHYISQYVAPTAPWGSEFEDVGLHHLRFLPSLATKIYFDAECDVRHLASEHEINLFMTDFVQ